MSKTIYRYLIPADGLVHEVDLHGDFLTVGSRSVGVVEFFALYDETAPAKVCTFTVVETGGRVPDGDYRGTTASPDGQLVWHLFELPSAPPPAAGHDPGQ